MKTIQFLIIMLLCLVNQPMNANAIYTQGDVLHVWANSGLNMREGPGTDFPKIKKLNYGDQVQVVDNYLSSTPFASTVVNKSKKSQEFVMHGFWVRVKIGTQEGYVFDGYLSRLPAMKKSMDNDNNTNTESFMEYAQREFGVAEHTFDSTYTEEVHTHYIFNNGIEWKEMGKECWAMNLELETLTFNEAYLLFNAIGEFEKINKMRKKESIDEYDFEPQIEIQKDKTGYYRLNVDLGMYGLTLSFDDGKFILAEWACC